MNKQLQRSLSARRFRAFAALSTLCTCLSIGPAVPAQFIPLPPPVKALDVTIATGGDDLRGGNDNAYFILYLKDGRQFRTSINGTARLADHTTRLVRVPVPLGGVDPALLGAFEVCGTMTGGWNGDNWNIDGITVQTVSEFGSPVIFSAFSSAPFLVRLTGDQPCALFHF